MAATEVTYQGLTHLCSNPDCHVPGFVNTLYREHQLPCPVCKGEREHSAACPRPVIGAPHLLSSLDGSAVDPTDRPETGA